MTISDEAFSFSFFNIVSTSSRVMKWFFYGLVTRIHVAERLSVLVVGVTSCIGSSIVGSTTGEGSVA